MPATTAPSTSPGLDLNDNATRTKRVFVIAEAGVNHNGDPKLARELVDKAYEGGADAVKFQTFQADHICHPDAPKAQYQRDGPDKDESQLEMLRSLELKFDEFVKLRDYAQGLGLEFMSTPLDMESMDKLVEMGMKRLKIASGELTNLPFLAHAARKNLPIILSTGMSSLAEVEEAVDTIASHHKRGRNLGAYLTLLHSTANYPTENDKVNISAITTLQKHFNCPVGYSDHTKGIVASPCAVSLGATCIAKHFTLSRGMEGPHHRASLEPIELRNMITNIREVEAMMLGGGLKAPQDSELEMQRVGRRSIILVKEKREGEALLAPDLRILRPGVGIPPKYISRVVGQKAGEPLQWEALQCGSLANGQS